MNSDVTTWALPKGAIARLGRGDVFALAFSPDKTHLAVGSSIGLWLYNMSTQEPIALWDTERGLICDIAFSLNRKWLSTHNLDGVVKVWDLQRGECVTRLELEDRISNIVFSPDSQGLAIAYLRRPRVEIRHPKTGELRAKFSGETEENGYSCIAFSPDTRFFAAAKSVDRDSDAERIEVWDIARGQQIAHLTGHTNGVRRISFSPCSRFLASGGQADGTVRAWEVENGQLNQNVEYGSGSILPSYSPEGALRVVADATDAGSMNPWNAATVTVWDVESGEKCYSSRCAQNCTITFSNGSHLAYQSGRETIEVWCIGKPHARKTIPSHFPFPNSVLFSDDGKTLAAEHRADGRLYTHGNVLLWDVATRQARKAVEAEWAFQYVHATFDGKRYVSSLDRNSVELWEIGDGESSHVMTATGHDNNWVRAAFAPTGMLFACADEKGQLNVWDVHSQELRCTFAHPLIDEHQIWTLEFSPDGKLLLSEADIWPSARLWDVEQSKAIEAFPGDDMDSKGGFSPCGRYLVGSRRSGGEFMVWNINHREILAQIPFLLADKFEYSPSGQYVACGGEVGEAAVLLWDLERSETHRRLPLPDESDWIHALAFSRCGKYLAGSGGWNRETKQVPLLLWEIATGKNLATFYGHTTDIQGLAFSPGSALLASASFDSTILLWDINL